MVKIFIWKVKRVRISQGKIFVIYSIDKELIFLILKSFCERIKKKKIYNF